MTPEAPPADVTMPPEILELFRVIDELPEEYQQRLQPVRRRVLEGGVRRRKILLVIQDALSELRLDMKYLIFDLEATRRERNDYRRRLEEQQGS